MSKHKFRSGGIAAQVGQEALFALPDLRAYFRILSLSPLLSDRDRQDHRDVPFTSSFQVGDVLVPIVHVSARFPHRWLNHASSVGNHLGSPPFPGLLEDEVARASSASTRSPGGATIDANFVAPYLPTVLSLTNQVNQFLTGAANKPTPSLWTSANALFTIWIGINDIGNSFGNGGDRCAFSDTLRNAYFALAQKPVRPLETSEAPDERILKLSSYSTAPEPETSSSLMSIARRSCIIRISFPLNFTNIQ
ncbi:hypothetical protein B0H19DRAFT_1378600 [Mycena capillaripes]|nr:hypothetical protein B0H19DRAFT_1378600 [Mycena capillaripes]